MAPLKGCFTRCTQSRALVVGLSADNDRVAVRALVGRLLSTGVLKTVKERNPKRREETLFVVAA